MAALEGAEPGAGLMPTEAGGNYFPEAPYLRETKTYLNYMHASESTLDSSTANHSSRHDMLALFRPAINTAHFYFFVAEVASNYLTTDGLKKFFSTSGGPLRLEARGICHICHMVNPALGQAGSAPPPLVDGPTSSRHS